MKPLLSIIIVYYENLNELLNCISSIRMQQAEIIIINNSATPELYIFGEIIWVNTGHNIGFAAGCNIGIDRSSADTILLLNPDTIDPNNSIEKCYYKFINSDAVACGVSLVDGSGQQQISGNYNTIGGLNTLLPLPFIGWILRHLGKLFHYRKPHIISNETVEVDWITGAFLMIKKDGIARAGLLDEDFFMYSEDAEWCGRLQKHGRILLFGEFQITHFGGKGYGNLHSFKGRQAMKSNLLRVRKQFGLGWYAIHWLLQKLNF